MSFFFLRRSAIRGVAGLAVLGCLAVSPALWAQEQAQAPDELIKRISSEVLDAIKADKAMRQGDMGKLNALVDEKILPYVNFQRMTSSAVGPAWRQATPEQQKRLQDEFKTLLLRTYSGALAQVSNQTIALRPLRAAPEDKEVVVRSEIRGSGEPVQLDYRMEKTAGPGAGWKIYNINVLGVWLVENYKTQFAQEINARGLDGLITSLSERNKANAAKKG